MKTYTMCGSMKFAKQMKEISQHLEEEKGFTILQCVYVDDISKLTKEDIIKLQENHYKKIDVSDGIYVVNIDGYIGESVKKEIEYAQKHNKEIIYFYKTLR